MKMDVVQRRGRKKDFWDLHELLNRYFPWANAGTARKALPLYP
ncbi:hypothetical protein [Echinicola soli]